MFVAGCEHRIKLAEAVNMEHRERLEAEVMRRKSITSSMNDRHGVRVCPPLCLGGCGQV